MLVLLEGLAQSSTLVYTLRNATVVMLLKQIHLYLHHVQL